MKGSNGHVDSNKTKINALLERYKYPLLFLALGVMLMLIPGSGKSSSTLSQSDALVSEILSSTQGVGDCLVLISDKGVVVVCRGADSAKVKMQIIQAVSSYTGYSSDKITILKMAD